MYSRVVILTDRSHSDQSGGVLVWFVGVDVVQGGGLSRVTVAGGKVNTHGEVDPTTSDDVVQE